MGNDTEVAGGERGKAENSKTVVTIKGPGVSVAREVTDDQAAEILNVILRPGDGASRQVGDVSRGRVGGVGPSEALAEFFRRVAPRRNPDKIVAIANYMSAAEGKKLFTPEEVVGRFKDVGEPVPGNFSRDLKWARQIGWLALDRETNQYYVTASGSKAVADRFPDDVTKATKIRPARGARRRNAVSSTSNE